MVGRFGFPTSCFAARRRQPWVENRGQISDCHSIKIMRKVGEMTEWIFTFNLGSSLWYTFDRTPLRGLEKCWLNGKQSKTQDNGKYIVQRPSIKYEKLKCLRLLRRNVVNGGLQWDDPMAITDKGGAFKFRRLHVIFWSWVRFPKQCWNVNWGHSAYCVKVSSRSHLSPQMRSRDKYLQESGVRKEEGRKEYGMRRNNVYTDTVKMTLESVFERPSFI